MVGRKAKEPGPGVWVAETRERTDGGQTSYEAIAVDGTTVEERVCHCGHDRHLVMVKAGELARARGRK